MKVFQPVRLAGLDLQSRIVMAPMTRYQAGEDCAPTAAGAAYYARRAEEGVGLIISEGTLINDSGKVGGPGEVPVFFGEKPLQGWKAVVDAIHAKKGAFFPQLWHCGRFAAKPVGPMACPVPGYQGLPSGSPNTNVVALSPDQIEALVAEYVKAAVAAKEMGCDGVEIHGAHGYLLCSFLCPDTNKRTDEYGGTQQNRMRFPLQVVRAIRAAVGPHFPISFRFSQWRLDDFSAKKFKTSEELATFLRALQENGATIVHASTYEIMTPAFPEEDPTRTLAEWCKLLSGGGLVVIGVGKITIGASFMDSLFQGSYTTVSSPAPAFQLIEDDKFDLLAVGRALIACPSWISTLKTKGLETIPPFHKSMLEKWPNL
eukprot:CAMPEP_0177633518 /NCGR_PEP_ID=MMETSP0447-20121125/2880_1 /TAXON_ID=0 /ORGANISM="Stygamoeba regulata, Strain BSH-02190019" /LENGTH=371 /DNA_ID=CAMNT_0019135183 /DNA_START=83 /DNA_END=1198 /DNA_ORIENTATION=+